MKRGHELQCDDARLLKIITVSARGLKYDVRKEGYAGRAALASHPANAVDAKIMVAL